MDGFISDCIDRCSDCCLAELECVTNPVEFGWVELETTSKDVVLAMSVTSWLPF